MLLPMIFQKDERDHKVDEAETLSDGLIDQQADEIPVLSRHSVGT